MVVGSCCSITIVAPALVSTINLTVGMCKRQRSEIRELGWMRTIAMVLCSGPSFLHEVMEARVRAGYADLEA